MLRVFPISLIGVAARWLSNEPTGSIKTLEDLKTKFLNNYCPPGRTSKKMEEINNFQQEPDETLYQVWERFKELLMTCPQHYLTEMQEVILFYNGLDVPTQQILDSRGVVPTKTAADAKTAIQEMVEYSQKCHNGTSRGRSTETSDGLAAIQAQLDNLGREIKKVNEKVYVAQVGCEQCKGPHYTKDYPQKEEDAALRNQGASIKTLEIQIGQMSKLIQTRYAVMDLTTTPASVSVMPLSTYLNLRLGELVHTRLTVELVDRTVKYPKGIAENVLVGIGKFTFPVDFIILDMPKDIRVPLILRRPFFLRERMELDLEARLMGETLVINRSLDPFQEDYIELNDRNEPFELRRNQGNDLMPTIEEGEIIEEFRTRDEDLDTGIDDYPNFVVLENMDVYRDEGMGDVIFGEPFLKEADIKAKRFDGMITLYKSDDKVTYQMVNEKDVMNGVSHAYKKLKGIYKGVLNLGPDYIRNAKTEEWLTSGHISMHELD
ncbi:putative reverse transcriptase domain-containing protein [Tanacetum coccineum]